MNRMQPATVFVRIGHLIGVALIGAGLLVIGIGWYGASGAGAKVNGQTTVAGQMPYLLSGGALGLGLIIIGAALLVVHALRTSRDRVEAALIALAQSEGAADVPADGSSLVVAGSASYHDVTCRLVASRADEHLLTPSEAMTRGLRPCRLCKPARPAAASTA